METEIDKYKRLLEDGFNKLVSDKSIADFKLDFAEDIDENGTLNVTAHVKLIPPITYLCDEIEYEIKRGLVEEGE